MSKVLDFYFDLASPYAYLASTQVDDVCARNGATARWRPFLLGGVFKATGNEMPARIPAKAAYMQRDLQAWSAFYGVPFAFPAHFPINSVKPMRVCLAAEEQGKLRELAEAMYRAYWAEGNPIDDPAVIAEVAADVGLDGEKLLARIEDQDIKNRLKENTEEAVRLGAFGAPFFHLDGQIFWGNDRLPLIEHTLKC